MHPLVRGTTACLIPVLGLGTAVLVATADPGAAHAATSASGQTTVTVAAAADSYTASAAPKTSYGTTVDFRVGDGWHSNRIGYVRFALSADQAARVASAKLVLTRDNHHLPATTITARQSRSTWAESSLDAANAPALGAILSSQAVNAANTTLAFDVTAAAQGQTAVGIALTAPITTDMAMFDSRESGPKGPQLVLTLNPPPAAPAPAPTPTPAPAPAPAPAPTCSISATLVSSCQVWFGDTPQAHTTQTLSPSQRLAIDETMTGRQFDIVHQYLENGTLFPNAETIGLAKQGRILSETWKPATDMSWAAEAAGGADARIDAEAAYLKANFNYPFFLSIYHEPEDNVNATPGSGMTAADYVAMFRHTVLRLRADGVTNAVTVINYMGYYTYANLRDPLYPGDDVVDWIAWDAYMHDPSNQAGHDFSALVDLAHGATTGFYDWASTAHPGKPLMIAEYGTYGNTLASNPNGPAQFYASMTAELSKFPALKALDYFDMEPSDVGGDANATAPSMTATGLAAWQQLAAAPVFNGPALVYNPDNTITPAP